MYFPLGEAAGSQLPVQHAPSHPWQPTSGLLPPLQGTTAGYFILSSHSQNQSPFSFFEHTTRHLSVPAQRNHPTLFPSSTFPFTAEHLQMEQRLLSHPRPITTLVQTILPHKQETTQNISVNGLPSTQWSTALSRVPGSYGYQITGLVSSRMGPVVQCSALDTSTTLLLPQGSERPPALQDNE